VPLDVGVIVAAVGGFFLGLGLVAGAYGVRLARRYLRRVEDDDA
jgi:hypothetical protein